MGAEGFLVIGVGLALGYSMASLFPKTKFGKEFMERKNPQSILTKNPEMVLKKLNNIRSPLDPEGKPIREFIDNKKDLNYSVITEEDGTERLGLDLKDRPDVEIGIGEDGNLKIKKKVKKKKVDKIRPKKPKSSK